jgi:hypothetical protein
VVQAWEPYEIEIPITFMISGVFEKDTTSGPEGQFVGSLCGEVVIANTAEYVQVLIWGCNAVTIKSDIWAEEADRLARETIQQVCNGVEPFYQVASRHRGLKQ